MTSLIMDENEIIEKLKGSDLFQNMKKEELVLFLDQFTFQVKSFQKNDVFAIAGDRVDNLMIVIKGCLIARMVADSGKQIQIDKIGEGRIVAPAMLFATENIMPVHVVPEEDCFVLFMKKNVFLQAMFSNENLMLNFIKVISDINRFLSVKIHSLSLKTIKGKLAEYILQLSQQQNCQSIVLSLTKQELADRFGVARQALSRIFTELETEKMITLKGKCIEVLDKKRLAELE